MSTVVRYALASPEEVFATISDPRTYPRWLVGAREIRSVEADWPAPGSRFHHRVGVAGPLTVADNTEVKEVDPPRRLVLEARARPIGRASVTFRLSEDVRPDGRQVTRIEMEEAPIGLLGALRPVLQPLTDARNRASLNALVADLNSPDDHHPGA